ncbi:MAG: hypothetical protein AAGD96_32480 [Chloroflexota bacterium]
MRQNKRIKAVIFDLDDTLIDWSGFSLSYLELVTPAYGRIHAHLKGKGHQLPALDQFVKIAMDSVISEWQEAKKTFAGANFGDALQKTLSNLAFLGEGA